MRRVIVMGFKDKLKADGFVASSVPVAASGQSIVGGSSGLGQVFDWSVARTVTRIVKSSTFAGVLKIAINRDGREEDSWDEELGSDERRLTITSVPVRSLSIWSDLDAEYGVDFVVYGWA